MESRAAKARLRAELKGRRATLTPRELAVAGQAAADLVSRLPEWRQSKVVALYASRGQEPSTDALLALALAEGRMLLLPRVEADGSLTLRRVDDLAKLESSALGIREPRADAPVVAAADAGLILVPGVGFDRRGHRLGHGAGYYDRLLARLPRRVFLLGHAHAFQMVGLVPTEPHDVKVRAVATPQAIIRCRPR
jgi:5-formyltetrahydrofolate cyclo-ligase